MISVKSITCTQAEYLEWGCGFPSQRTEQIELSLEVPSPCDILKLERRQPVSTGVAC